MQFISRDELLEYFLNVRYGSLIKVNKEEHCRKVFVVVTKFTENEDEYKIAFTDFSTVTIKYNSEAKLVIDGSGLCLTDTLTNTSIVLWACE